MNGGLLKKDWFLALAVSLVFVLAFLSDASFLEKMERIAYDTGVSLTNRNPGAAERIVIIAIDDTSIERIGRWPWSRTELARMVRKLAKAKTKVVGMQIFLTESQSDVGLKHIRKIKKYVSNARFPRAARRQVASIKRQLRAAEIEMDADRQLAQVIPLRKNLYMPMFFKVGEPIGNPDGALPRFVRRNQLTTIHDSKNNEYLPISTMAVNYPLRKFGNGTAGIGHLNLDPDSDGGIRKEVLLYEHYGKYYPSLALLMASRSLNLSPRHIRVELAKGVEVGKLYIKTDKYMRMLTGFYPPKDGKPVFKTYSFVDVRDGKIPMRTFRNKIVIIGSTALGVGNYHLTPVNAAMHSPELTANIIASILNQDFYTHPATASAIEFALFTIVIFYLAWMLPRFRAGNAALMSLILLFALLIGGQIVLLSQKMWIQTVSPALLLLLGHLLLTTRRFLATEKLKDSAESDSAQTNRMLGLTFQNQGQLDMAMDKFRRLPLDNSVLELFYNLALDFERKRQFSKAASCYDYILQHNRKFRDVKKRRQQANQMEGTIILGARGASAGGTLIIDSGGVTENPILGRYKLERELGRGAMGTVYLGKDPKINRVVAIKTLDLSAEFEESDIEQVKERFFREAETAGRLNHPNIVTIYDAGEEHDLAYIAMEFLKGEDLTKKLAAKKMLPVRWVLQVAIQVADALDYAHKLGVVHRDIKPANIMYNDNDNSIKVTDFGIARITDTSKTKTGVVLGTPSYMSPEQFSGKRVDGRSDLFSLGVTLFELLTGKQPFGGESLAELMYQITNKKHPNILKLRNDLPVCIKTIIDSALSKEPEDRFQSGEQFAQSLRRCKATLPEKGN